MPPSQSHACGKQGLRLQEAVAHHYRPMVCVPSDPHEVHGARLRNTSCYNRPFSLVLNFCCGSPWQLVRDPGTKRSTFGRTPFVSSWPHRISRVDPAIREPLLRAPRRFKSAPTPTLWIPSITAACKHSCHISVTCVVSSMPCKMERATTCCDQNKMSWHITDSLRHLPLYLEPMLQAETHQNCQVHQVPPSTLHPLRRPTCVNM